MMLRRFFLKLSKTLLKCLLGFLLALIAYGLLSLLLGIIPVNRSVPETANAHTIYLSTNGIHLDIIVPTALAPDSLRAGLHYGAQDRYLAFGWGDEDFYINTPEWGDLTARTALSAAFLPSPTLMHLTRYRRVQAHWISISVTQEQLVTLTRLIDEHFERDAEGQKIHLPGVGYTARDDFYRAQGSYSFVYTCNTWANALFKDSGLRAVLWTPWDFALLHQYR